MIYRIVYFLRYTVTTRVLNNGNYDEISAWKSLSI